MHPSFPPVHRQSSLAMTDSDASFGTRYELLTPAFDNPAAGKPRPQQPRQSGVNGQNASPFGYQISLTNHGVRNISNNTFISAKPHAYQTVQFATPAIVDQQTGTVTASAAAQSTLPRSQRSAPVSLAPPSSCFSISHQPTATAAAGAASASTTCLAGSTNVTTPATFTVNGDASAATVGGKVERRRQATLTDRGYQTLTFGAATSTSGIGSLLPVEPTGGVPWTQSKGVLVSQSHSKKEPGRTIPLHTNVNEKMTCLLEESLKDLADGVNGGHNDEASDHDVIESSGRTMDDSDPACWLLLLKEDRDRNDTNDNRQTPEHCKGHPVIEKAMPLSDFQTTTSITTPVLMTNTAETPERGFFPSSFV